MARAETTRRSVVVRLEVNSSMEAFARSQRVTSLDLRSDANGQPDDIVIGSLTLQLLRRDDDFAIRVRVANRPARLSFPGVPAYPIAPAWRIVARLESHAAEKQVIYEDSEGRRQVYWSPGLAVFEKDGVTCRTEPVYESDRKRPCVLFSGPTNFDETYEAGRFLYVPRPASQLTPGSSDFDTCAWPRFDGVARVAVRASGRRSVS